LEQESINSGSRICLTAAGVGSARVKRVAIPPIACDPVCAGRPRPTNPAPGAQAGSTCLRHAAGSFELAGFQCLEDPLPVALVAALHLRRDPGGLLDEPAIVAAHFLAAAGVHVEREVGNLRPDLPQGDGVL